MAASVGWLVQGHTEGGSVKDVTNQRRASHSMKHCLSHLSVEEMGRSAAQRDIHLPHALSTGLANVYSRAGTRTGSTPRVMIGR